MKHLDTGPLQVLGRESRYRLRPCHSCVTNVSDVRRPQEPGSVVATPNARRWHGPCHDRLRLPGTYLTVSARARARVCVCVCVCVLKRAFILMRQYTTCAYILIYGRPRPSRFTENVPGGTFERAPMSARLTTALSLPLQKVVDRF